MPELASSSASREKKSQAVGSVQEKLKAARMALVTEYRGLTVAQMTRLRRDLRNARGEYKIVKNTLVRRALKGTAYSALDQFLQGPTGWVFGYEDPVALTKVLVKFLDENQGLTIKGGLLEGHFLDQARVKDLSKLPSRPEIVAMLLSVMQAPAVQLLRLMQEPGARLVRTLEALRKKKESEG